MIGVFAARALWRARRRTLAVGAVELSLFSVALYVGINEALYGGPTPYSADVAGETATDASFPVGYLERAYRLVALFIDRDYGLLRWAPVFALAFVGLWWLWRSRRERLARAVPGRARRSRWRPGCAPPRSARSCSWPPSSPPRCSASGSRRGTCSPALPLAVPLVAWGLRHAPRVGIALSRCSRWRRRSGSTSTCAGPAAGS